jgi:hypothetical protein
MISVFLENIENNGSEGMAIIRDIYDGAHELFESELERALEAGLQTIIIEPIRLGEETARWISIGNCLNKTSIITGLGSIISGMIWSDKPNTQCSLATISLLSHGIHSLSWQFDPCSNYKVETDPKKIAELCVDCADQQKPVVLIRRPNYEIKRNNIFQTAISLIAFAFSAWKLYKSFKFAIV